MPMMQYAIRQDAMKHGVRGDMTNALKRWGLSMTDVASAKEQIEQQVHLQYPRRMWPGFKNAGTNKCGEIRHEAP